MTVRVIVIGGGIGGLTAALALRQAGFEPAVFERAPELREVGAGITLWSNAVRCLRRLGREEAVRAVGTPLLAAEVRDWGGRIIKADRTDDLAERFGAPTLGIHRADLQAALAAGLEPGVVRAGHTCIGFRHDTNGVVARFDGGLEERGDLLVGADGLRSAVRRQLLGDEPPRYAGYTAWRGVARGEHPALKGGISVVALGRGAQFGLVPIGRDRTYWFGTSNHPLPTGDGPGNHRESALARVKGWYAPIREVVAATEPSAVLRNDVFDRPPVHRWGEERVTMLGDAAHPTTPNLGQGACQAIESAVVLAECLRGESELVAGLRRYEARRQPRTAWITKTSWDLGKVAAWEGWLACWLRDQLIAAVPSFLAGRHGRRMLGSEESGV
jgi:2-polyprenyl-6-methoxyphenol hydroxylase-like FAD-dependent oxidoreductase